MAKIIVFGSSGFIGSHFVSKLREIGHTVYTPNLKQFPEQLDFWLEAINPEYVFHLAGYYPYLTEDVDVRNGCYKNNTDLTLKIVKACEKTKTHLIYTSSNSVYGTTNNRAIATESTICNPTDHYGASKLMSELFIKTANLKYTILRICNVYGPGQKRRGLLGTFTDLAMGGIKETCLSFPIERAFQFTYIEDVIEGLILSMGPKARNQTYNMCAGGEYSIKTLLRDLKLITGNELIINIIDKNIDPYYCMSTCVIKTDLGWENKMPLEHGLRNLVDWFKNER